MPYVLRQIRYSKCNLEDKGNENPYNVIKFMALTEDLQFRITKLYQLY